MKKLLSLMVAAVFAVSSGFALAASHAGAPMKKDEMKKDGIEIFTVGFMLKEGEP